MKVSPNSREEPPYKVEESGYAGFLMPIEVYFKNKEKPKKRCLKYDLFLNLEGNQVNQVTFNNPTKEFRRKLIKAGGCDWILFVRGPETGDILSSTCSRVSSNPGIVRQDR